MRLSTFITAGLLGAVSALPGPLPPAITAAPELKAVSSTNDESKACKSTNCWASYAECHGSLTFVYLCFTPPPCGTATSPDPYSCPPKSTSSPTSKAALPSVPVNSTSFTISRQPTTLTKPAPVETPASSTTCSS